VPFRMQLKVALIVALCVGCVLAEDERLAFARFMRTYKKQYGDVNEFNTRFGNFKANLQNLEQVKKTNPSAGVTKFFDMTAEEFHKYPCGVNTLSELNVRRPDFEPVLANESDYASLRKIQAPASWDWTTKGAVTPIKDQGQCGSCWAFSTIGNIEGIWVVGGKHSLTSLSEQQEVDCSQQSGDEGCDGGWPFWAMTDMIADFQGNIDTETAYPYTAQDGTCAYTASGIGATISTYKSWCTESTNPCDETQMMTLLYTYGPLSACLDATSMQSYTGGIDPGTGCSPDAIDHCITIVGYATDAASSTPYWKIKNSWGTDWGESGFYRLIRNQGACGINKVITIASV